MAEQNQKIPARKSAQIGDAKAAEAKTSETAPAAAQQDPSPAQESAAPAPVEAAGAASGEGEAAGAAETSGETASSPPPAAPGVGTQDGATVEPARPATGLRMNSDTAYAQFLKSVEVKHGPGAVVQVEVHIPKAFKVTLDNGAILHFSAGVHPIPRFLADHWYVKANGVTPYVRPAGENMGNALTAEVYEDALKAIHRGDMKLDYAIKNIASYFKVDEAVVRDEFHRLTSAKK